ncbi:MAG: phenylalanine--tRNA ligase subunit beta [Armatimonadetes bacterium]|nr:phenylalanine--tRNA ligase subunit beta [Armatimonadota bacterium]
MRIPYRWLKELLPDAPEPEKLASALTMGGLEIEEIVSWRSEDGRAEDLVLLSKVTANRGDLLSMVGVARQAAAVLGIDWQPPSYSIAETEQPLVGWPVVQFSDATIEVQAPEACPRYSALLISGVRVGPSPDWLRWRLEAAGVRSICNVVDATNYVVWELGQPLHAFDFKLIVDGHVIVRMARDGEVIVTIDGQARALSSEDLVIADPKFPIALAGVMGGLDTEVRASTTRVLLESAHFDATTIRKTSLRVGLSTEASYRFERYVDPNLTLAALARAARIIQETAGGTIEGPALDLREREFAPRRISLRPARCNALLGTDIQADQMAAYLRRLGMEVQESAAAEPEVLEVVVPTFRADVEREVDLIEEIAIVHGYDNIPLTIHGHLVGSGRLNPAQRLERRVRELLRECGLSENLSYSMMSPDDLDKLNLPPDAAERRIVRLANPMSADASVLRTTLLPALLNACLVNQNQGVADVALFEIAPVFIEQDGEKPAEPKRLAGVLMGNPFTAEWGLQTSQVDFFWAKGIIEQLAEALGVELQWRPTSHPTYYPGQAAEVVLNGRVVGRVGRIAKSVLEAYDLRKDVYAFELDYDALAAAAQPLKQYSRLPVMPAARRDVAVVAPDDDQHSAAALADVIRQAGGELLESVTVFDVGADPKRFGPGRRSIAFRLVWRAPDRTLTDEEVEGLMAAVFEALRAAGAEIRAS